MNVNFVTLLYLSNSSKAGAQMGWKYLCKGLVKFISFLIQPQTKLIERTIILTGGWYLHFPSDYF